MTFFEVIFFGSFGALSGTASAAFGLYFLEEPLKYVAVNIPISVLICYLYYRGKK